MSTIRSTIFLSTFVSSFQALVCLYRATKLPDHKYLYWLWGLISASSILIEKKDRRGELAMYVLPKGLEALYNVTYEKSGMYLPYFEVGMFMTAMGVIIVSFFA